MFKMPAMFLSGLALAFAPVAVADAAVLGPDAVRCTSGSGPAVLVRVVGLKSRTGAVRVRTFSGANRASWFNKRQALRRTEVDIPSSGPVEICMPVPTPGSYVIDLRHDANANGDTDRADGAGASGNPDISLFDFLLGSKPPASRVTFQVGDGVTTIAVVMKYVQGGSFRPVSTAVR